MQCAKVQIMMRYIFALNMQQCTMQKRDLMNMMVRKKNAIINKCNMSEMLQRSFAHIATLQNWGNIELQVLQGEMHIDRNKAICIQRDR